MDNAILGNNTFRYRVKKGWSHAWKYPGFRWQFVITMLCLASFPILFNGFFDFVENRTGKQLNDPLLNLIPSHDVSWTVFFFLYAGVIIGISCTLHQPKYLLLALQTYLVVTVFRMGTITLFPLEPPIGYIPLREPIVQMVTNGGRIISKDLFFSGHMSTILSLFFSVQHRHFRTVLFMFVLMVAMALLVQHVHYTIDIIAAPLGTWICFRFNQTFLQKWTY